MEPTVKYIGKVSSCLQSIEDCPLQENENAPKAIIEIFPEYLDATEDIKIGDKIILLTWLHKASRNILKTKPRNSPKEKLTGVFSTRSPDRPTPIGIHFVEVVLVAQEKLHISGLEVLDQTPVIDIKPNLD